MGVRHGRLLVTLIALDEAGKPVDQTSQNTGVLTWDFAPAQYEKIAAAGIGFREQFRSNPGSTGCASAYAT